MIVSPLMVAVTDGLTPASNPVSFLPSFPYLGVPNDGFDHPSA